MNQPLIETVLKKDVWIEETYVKTGGYGDNDPNKEFIKQFLSGETFPAGEYSIYAGADFYTLKEGSSEPDSEQEDYRFHTDALEIPVE
jgi:hypothetical protein